MKFSLAKKIALPFVIILILIAMMTVSTFIAHGVDSGAIESVDREVKTLHAMTHLQEDVAALLMAVNDFIITGKVEYRVSYDTLLRKTREGFTKLSELPLTSGERASLSPIHDSLEHIDETAQKIFRLEHVKTNERAQALMEEMDYRYGDRVYGLLEAMTDSAATAVTAAVADVRGTDRWEFWLMAGPSILAFVVGIGVVVLTLKRISKPLLELVHMAEKITARDFTISVNGESEDEIGMLTTAFKVMADEIKRRYEELENFAYIVAHDLKNPVVGIQGISEILATDYAPKLDASAKENLELIINSTKHMASLINDLLEFARAGKVEFEREPVSMDKMLGEIKRELTLFAGDRKAIIEVAGNLPAILCDPIRFSQVWKNLIGNAVKYNDKPSPRIEIGLETAKDPQKSYQFYVKDDGIGIDARHFETIFMPFKRAATSKKYEGTGIGLAIVKRVIDFHGGRIWLTSKLGEGTVFHFTVPKPLAANLNGADGGLAGRI